MTKELLHDLAILGGVPAFAEMLHVGRPNIGSRAQLMARINDLLDRRWLTNNGPYVQELEQKLREFLGVKHAVAVCNGTIALEIAIRALDLSGEVIVPSWTFVATAHALAWQGLEPVFCDVDAKTHNLDPRRLKQLITERTSGIIGVHVWGRPCPVDEIAQVAAERRLRVIYDAAHAFGCAHGGKSIGGFGDAEVFSFHATKFFNSFEGGAVATNDDEVARRLRLTLNFGFEGYDNSTEIGTNGKMTEVCAAMGLTSLESIADVVAANRRNYESYRSLVAGLPGVELAQYPSNERTNYQYVVLEIDEAAARLSRDTLMAVLHAERVFARRYFFPGCHRMVAYRKQGVDVSLPVTEALAQRVLCLPTGTTIQEKDIATICSIIRTAINNASELNRRLGERA